MKRARAPFDAVRALGLALPGVEETTSYGTPALKVSGKLLCRLKEDGETLVLRTDMWSRDLLLQADPETFFITEHYRDYPMVLLRLRAVKRARLRELLETSYRMLSAKKRPAAKKPNRKTRTPRSS